MSAKYKILAEDLRQLLKNPTFDPSGRLPTEQEIGNTYHVSRQTVRQALSLLAEVLSWPWPKSKEFRSVTKTGMATDLITPDVSFEPIFIQAPMIQQFQKM